MKIISATKSWIRRKIQMLVKAEVEKAISQMATTLIPQLIDFHKSPLCRRQSFQDHTKDPLKYHDYYCGLRDRLGKAGVTVEDISVDIGDFQTWLAEYPEIDKYFRGFGEVYIEKSLEHYLSFKHLNLVSSDTIIDIGAGLSPWSEILRRKAGLVSYRLDLSYKPGINGYDIGANGVSIPLPNGYARALALHDTYQFLAGDDDITFSQEASRILKPGGRYVIVPLHLDNVHFILTSPFCDQKEVKVDPGAIKVWRDDLYLLPFSRHYSPETFFERIYNRIPHDLMGKVRFVRNLPDLMSYFPGQRIYSYFLLCCEKRNPS